MGTTRVLIVDDDPAIRRSLEKTLIEANYYAQTADSCISALDLIKLNPFDLYILDMNMPDWSGHISEQAGLLLLKEIHSEYPEAKVIILTAGSTDLNAIAALRSGAVEYLVKGLLSNREFLAKVADVLSSSSSNTMGQDISITSIRETDKQIHWLHKWLINHTNGILDEVVAGIILTTIFYFGGKLLGLLNGLPFHWLREPTSIIYLLSSIIIIITILVGYIRYQHKFRRTEPKSSTFRKRDDE